MTKPIASGAATGSQERKLHQNFFLTAKQTVEKIALRSQLRQNLRQ